MKELLLWLALAQSADLATTHVGLSRGCMEIGPIFRSTSVRTMYLTKGAGSVGLIISLPILHRERPKLSKGVAWTWIVSGFGSAAWNLTQIPKCGRTR